MSGKLRHPGVGGVGRERRLAELASQQHGIVTRPQLLAIGLSEKTIDRWLSTGRLHRIHWEAYALGHDLLSQRGRWSAAVLAYGEGALLSHLDAACLWGLTGVRGPVDVTAPLGRQGVRRRPGIRLHRCKIHPDDHAVEDGIPLTTVARTLFDVSEVVDYPRFKRTCEEADRLKLLRLAEFERVVERGRGRRALKPARRLLGELRATTTTRSPLEDRFLAFCEANGLPAPATNVLVLGHEVDALWPDARLVVELDGWEYHRHHSAFQRDRARDSARLAAGYRTVHVTHERLDRESRTLLAELRALLGLNQ